MRRTNPRSNRRGVILVVAIVCVVIASILFLTLVKTAARCHEVSALQARETQAIWLAESGLERAAAQLRKNPDYRGETWTVPPEVFGGGDGGLVQIEVEPLAEVPGSVRVRARADYPNVPYHRARRECEAIVALPNEPKEKPLN